MLIETGIAKFLAAFQRGAIAITEQLRPVTADDAPDSEPAPVAQAPLANLSLTGLALLPAAIFPVTFVAIEISHASNFIVTFWPTNAIMLVALLRYVPSLRNYGAILAGSACAIVLASVATGNSLKFSAILTAMNIIEVAVTWALLSLLKIGVANLTSFKNLLKFIIVAAVAVPMGTVAVGAMVIGSEHAIPWRAVWLHSYPAHALGIMVVAPFLISVMSPELQSMRIRRRVREVVAIFTIAVAIAACGAYFRPLVFMTVPVILFATLRFGLIGATTSNLMFAVVTGTFVIFGIGQPLIARAELPDRVVALQVLLAFTSLWCLPIAALLAERDRLLGDLSLANAQLKTESETKSHLVIGLRRHLSIAEERERLRLSYELHDQAGQDLIAAILELNEIDSLIYGPARARLNLVRKKMEELGKTLHRIAWELRPPAIDELGLRKALASYIADWSERCATEVDFHCDDPNLDEVPSEIGTTVYRIVQEGLTNILKHAHGPSDVSVVIRRVGVTLQVTIEDNGCGFDVGAMAAKPGGYSGLGLDGMRGRLILIGGTLEVESAVGAGTTIFARIALDGQRSAA
jgi:signal transduction histidine kinase